MLKGAVIGVGSMGRNHVRVLNDIEHINLCGVSDVDAKTAAEVGRKYRVRPYTDYLELLETENPDFVVVAVPTIRHREVALSVMKRGIHLLIEKPIALTTVEAEEMISSAVGHGVKLAVGHVERFNPAVMEIRKRILNNELGNIFHLHARRLGPFPPRILDVGVAIDLATHDLDIMCYLVKSKVERVFAETNSYLNRDHEDMISGILRFKNGVIGVLDTNWLTPTKIRDLTVTGEKGTYYLNYLSQDLILYENYGYKDDNGGWNVREGNMIKPFIQRQEPLRLELESFVKAINTNSAVTVSGEDGLNALKIALSLVSSGSSREPKRF